jgi:hypothetical protein
MSDRGILPELGQRLLELTSIQLPVAVEVHASENEFERTDANSALLLHEKLELEV